jgi:hypothetical protein
MKGPAIVASLFVLYTASTAIHTTQVQGQGSAPPAFEVASVKPSNPESENPLSALPVILPSWGGGYCDQYAAENSSVATSLSC